MTLSEQELVIRVALDETEVTYTGSGSVWVGRLQRLAKQVGCVGETLSPEVYRVCIPVDRVRLLAVKFTKVLTEAQKQAAGERLAKSRQTAQLRLADSATQDRSLDSGVGVDTRTQNSPSSTEHPEGRMS